MRSLKPKFKMAQPIRGRGGHLVFPIGPKNTNVVEDVEILLSVKILVGVLVDLNIIWVWFKIDKCHPSWIKINDVTFSIYSAIDSTYMYLHYINKTKTTQIDDYYSYLKQKQLLQMLQYIQWFL